MTLVKHFEGYDNFVLKQSFQDTIGILKANNIQYKLDHWSNKGCTPEVPWDIIRTNGISFFFAKDKMFKIYFEEGFTDSLFNGIRIGMSMEEALSIDPSLSYDEWEENYSSEKGYWLEDNLENNTVMSITVFIKELEDDDTFFSYNWCK